MSHRWFKQPIWECLMPMIGDNGKQLSAQGRVLLATIRVQAMRRGYCSTGQVMLSKMLGVSVDTIKLHAKELVDGGWIRVKHTATVSQIWVVDNNDADMETKALDRIETIKQVRKEAQQRASGSGKNATSEVAKMPLPK